MPEGYNRFYLFKCLYVGSLLVAPLRSEDYGLRSAVLYKVKILTDYKNL